MIKKLGDASWEVLIKKGLSKQDEYEADSVGTEDLYALGYHPYGISNFLEKLKPMENEKGGKMKVLLSTHPAPTKRIEELNKFIGEKGFSAAGKPELADRLQSFKQAHPL